MNNTIDYYWLATGLRDKKFKFEDAYELIFGKKPKELKTQQEDGTPIIREFGNLAGK